MNKCGSKRNTCTYYVDDFGVTSDLAMHPTLINFVNKKISIQTFFSIGEVTIMYAVTNARTYS